MQKWNSNFPNPQAIENWESAWADMLFSDNITLEDCKRGLKTCTDKYQWPPSYAEFKSCCKLTLDYKEAYENALHALKERDRYKGLPNTSKEAWQRLWSHPAVYWAAIEVGFYDLNNKSFQQIEKRWKAAIDRQLEKPCHDDIPLPLIELPKLYKKNTEVANKHMVEMRRLLGQG
jgi:hypothetical protein